MAIIKMALSLKPYTWSYVTNEMNLMLKERSEKERETSLPLATMAGDPLPEDVITEILSWLPVKTLLQFKSVCKSWYAIITNPRFISKHLENYYNNDKEDDSGCFLVQYYVSHAELQLFELLVDENETSPAVLSYEILYGMPMYASFVCGPCDGLYYLYHYDHGDRALWNPAIGELKRLPPLITKPDLPSNLTYSEFDVYGFGLDPATKDYKVVVLKSYWYKTDHGGDRICRHPLSVLVYSLNKDSWRYWGDLALDYFLDNNKSYVCENGTFYWLGLCDRDDDNSEVIISFNMAADAYQEIQVPDYDEPASKCLALYKDSVALFTVHEILNVFDIWSMNDGCWTKKLSIGPVEGIWQPVGHWKNDRLILESNSRELMLCEPALTGEVKKLGFQWHMQCKGIYNYKESLVSLKDRGGCGHQSEKADQVTRYTYVANEEYGVPAQNRQLSCDQDEDYEDSLLELFP